MLGFACYPLRLEGLWCKLDTGKLNGVGRGQGYAGATGRNNQRLEQTLCWDASALLTLLNRASVGPH